MPRPRPRLSLRIGNASITIYNPEDLEHIDDIVKTLVRYNNITTVSSGSPSGSLKGSPPPEEGLYIRERLSDMEAVLEKITSQIEAIEKRLRSLENIASEKLLGDEGGSTSFVTAEELTNNQKKKQKKERRGSKPASGKQRKYIWSLLKRTGVTADEIKEKFGADLVEGGLSSEKASEIISYLQSVAEKGEKEGRGKERDLEKLEKLEPADEELIEEAMRLARRASRIWNLSVDDAITQACVITTNGKKTTLDGMTRGEVEKVIEWFKERLG